jgi:hemerythrin-like metal-binding protein
MAAKLISFDDSLKTGNALLDSQHEEFFRRANALFDNPFEEKTSETYEALDFLRTYVLFHFEREEELMRSAGYDGMEKHAAAHLEFRTAVEQCWLDMEYNGYSDELSERLRILFSERLVEHIRDLDGNFVAFLADGGENSTR